MRSQRPLALVLIVLMVILVGSYAYGEEPKAAEESSVSNPWRFEATLWLWLTGMEGTVGVGGVTAPVDESIGDTISKLEGGLAGRFEAWKGNWGGFVDGMYVKLSDDVPASGPVAGGNVVVKEGIVEFGALYRLPKVTFGAAEEQELLFDLIAAGRYTTLSNEVNLSGAGPLGMTLSGEATKDWVEPYLGGRVLWGNVFGWTEALSLGVRGDIGGFGVGSDFTWNVILAAQYRLSRLLSLKVGWRWYNVDFDSGSGTSRFVYDIQMSGPVLALTFHF